MQKIIKQSVKEGWVQITIADERWYIFEDGIWEPSVTFIASAWPKGIELIKYIDRKGFDEAEAVKVAAGAKGTKIHLACEQLAQGKSVNWTKDKFLNTQSGIEEELTPEEVEAIYSFQNFLEEVNPKIHLTEKVVRNEKDHYAGTMDLVLEIGGELGILDIKSSQYIWPSYKIQLPAYKAAFPGIKVSQTHGGKKIQVLRPIEKLWILRVGYKRNQDKWKLDEIEDRYDLFQVAHAIWREDFGKIQPRKFELPEVFQWRQKVEKKQKINRKL